jgi:NADH:ubiquinone oxidoreductase subunit F (NADH-binding)
MSASTSTQPLVAARLLAGLGRPPTLTEHLRVFGPLRGDRDIIGLLAAAGLHGRGGAAFPTARKLAAVVGAGGRRAIVVANAVEGEPTSKKDRSLLRVAPHLVLDGAELAAHTVGAHEVVFGVTQPTPELEAAIRERDYREDRLQFELRRVPASFVAGEETALVRALAGGPAKPTLKPPYPAERGLRGRPTLVQNVETLAHIALIARFGPDWYRPGTALVTLAGAVREPGVHEIPLGLTLTELFAACGGLTGDLAGILVGGYFGEWVEPTAAQTLTASPAIIGAGSIVALPASTCAVAECARVVRYLAGESAGQCGPCVHGLAALADSLDPGRHGDLRGEAFRFAGLVLGRGACRHPDGASRFARSALEVFDAEFARHASHRGCGRRDERVLGDGKSRR